MKRFLVCAAVFAAMLLTVSCGGDGGTYTDGERKCFDNIECKGGISKLCVEGDKEWYEAPDGKKFSCEKNDNCDKALTEFVGYCTNGSLEYDDETGAKCTKNTDEDHETCNGEDIMYCIKDDEQWYKVGDKTFKCNKDDNCVSASLELADYCGFDNGNMEKEGDYMCIDAEDCADGSKMRSCTKGDEGYFEVNGKKYEYNKQDTASMASAAQQATAACNPE